MMSIRPNYEKENQYEMTYEGRKYLVSITKCRCYQAEHCKYYKECKLFDIPIRRFMCTKYVNIYFTKISPCIFWMSIVLSIILFINNKKIVAVVFFVAISLCLIITETIVRKINQKTLIKKLKSMDSICIQCKAEEAKISETVANVEDLLIIVKEIVESLKSLLVQNDFGESKEKLSLCIKEICELINLTQNDNLHYKKLEYFFEIYLPEFERTIRMYADLKERNNKSEETLKECIEKFNLYLDLQKKKLNNESSELEFYGQAKAVIALMEKNDNV